MCTEYSFGLGMLGLISAYCVKTLECSIRFLAFFDFYTNCDLRCLRKIILQKNAWSLAIRDYLSRFFAADGWCLVIVKKERLVCK